MRKSILFAMIFAPVLALSARPAQSRYFASSTERGSWFSDVRPTAISTAFPTRRPSVVVTVTSAPGLSSRTVWTMRSLSAATRSSGSVRLTATTRSTNSTPPDWRARSRSIATIPGTRARRVAILLAAPAGAVSVRVSMVRRPSRQPAMQMKTATAIAAIESADA